VIIVCFISDIKRSIEQEIIIIYLNYCKGNSKMRNGRCLNAFE